jgi:hypothetical protein
MSLAIGCHAFVHTKTSGRFYFLPKVPYEFIKVEIKNVKPV